MSTGIGGVVSGGWLPRGRSGLASHFGQVLPLPEGPGQRFEDGASGRWIAAEGARHELPAEARAVFEAAAESKDWAEAILQTSAGRVARLCHSLRLMFDPGRIVIGGGVELEPGHVERLGFVTVHLPPGRPAVRQGRAGA